jgi:exopolysaccharide biosynthesis protein
MLVLAGATPGCAGRQAPLTSGEAEFLREHGIRYWLVVRDSPRPLRIHHLQIDLTNHRAELSSALADDPDGDGPANAALEPPLSIARRSGAIAMVNANPWQGLPDASGKRSTNWREGMPVQILGLAVSNGRSRCRPDELHCGFWLDEQGKVHLGDPADAAKVREGVAGFGRLVRDGRNTQPSGGPIHPRTALGLDAAGRFLYLVVVDGRQPLYSEGMNNDELARYMLELGCRDAMNLDGGGSSIMILGDKDGKLRIMNDPSTKVLGASTPRPIPVGLVVRPRGR